MEEAKNILGKDNNRQTEKEAEKIANEKCGRAEK